MNRRHVVAFTIPAYGHINRLLPVVAGLRGRGVTIDFFAHEMARARIEQAGARFVNIYARRDMDVPDGETLPLAMRNVSFAGYWGEDVAQEVAALRPDLIMHDTCAVIGRVVANRLKVPRLAMRAGHNLEPNRIRDELPTREPVRISEQCWDSVRKLRDLHGIADASPYSYFTDSGADLNICSEPPEFLPPDQRAPFEPLEFFGSYWPGTGSEGPAEADPFGPEAAGRRRVYAGFGTVAWMRDSGRVLRVLETVADALAADPDVAGLISLGNLRAPEEDLRRLRRPNVRVERYVDQIAVLRRSAVLITHNGLNSTHEAIVHGVPMISCPFYHDQPSQAALCEAMGLSLRLPADPAVADVTQALDRLRADAAGYGARLQQARAWELAVMERRPAVLDRIIALMEKAGPDAAQDNGATASLA